MNGIIDIWSFPEQEAEDTLRAIISGYTGTAKEKLTVETGPFQKPTLKRSDVGTADFPVEFNLTHSEGEALLAISDQPVGIDLQKGEGPKSGAAAELVCTKEELSIYSRLPIDKQRDFFFKLWVRKEAIVKALGMDMLPRGSQFQAAAEDGLEPNGYSFVKRGLIDGKWWYFHELFVPSGWYGMICSPYEKLRILRFFWPRDIQKASWRF